jgi:mono/diheme cytochrome c family protein
MAKRRQRPDGAGALAVVIAFALGHVPLGATAEASLEEGQRTYVEACAGCHGMSGTGDGPAGALLTVEVPDLTRIAWRNDGTYDLVRVVQVMDGRQGLAAHGGPMPLYGGLLTGPAAVIDGPDGSPVQTTEPILAIARWLATIQETPQ